MRHGIGGTTRHRIETAWGPCILERSERGLARFRLPDPETADGVDNESGQAATPTDVAAWAEMVRAYFDRAPIDFSAIPLDTTGLTTTERSIYDALRAVPYGATTTYGDLAAQIGLPGAARAVGVAMARNPWPLIVPCHRVLAKGGALHGFSAPGGLDTKRRMLVMEGVDLDRGEPMLPGLFDDA